MRNLNELEEEYEDAAFGSGALPAVPMMAPPPPVSRAPPPTSAPGLASLVAAMRRTSDGPPPTRLSVPSATPPIVVHEVSAADSDDTLFPT